MRHEVPGLVVVGGSIAGLTTVQELRLQGYRGPITVVDRDVRAPYRRPDVSKSLLLAEPGARTLLRWDEALEVNLVAPATAIAVDLEARVVAVETPAGERVPIPYETLVIASGAVARTPSFGQDSARTHTLRGIADAERFRAALESAGCVVVIGGGLIGLEVAAGLSARGKQVTVVEVEDKPLRRVLGDAVADRLVAMLRARGVTFRLGISVAEVDNATVRLNDGTSVEGDVVLVAVGARPATDWLAGSGLDLTDGIQCDEHGAAIGTTNVYAVGDVANWPNLTLGRRTRSEHWNNAIEHGMHVARRILGGDVGDGFRSVPYFWSDQADLKLQVLGSTLGHDDVRIVHEDGKSFVAEYRRDGRLVAVGGLNAGRAVMTRRAELAAEFSRSATGVGVPG